jgi:hypothetical protein
MFEEEARGGVRHEQIGPKAYEDAHCYSIEHVDDIAGNDSYQEQHKKSADQTYGGHEQEEAPIFDDGPEQFLDSSGSHSCKDLLFDDFFLGQAD